MESRECRYQTGDCIIIHGFAGTLQEVEPLAHALAKMDYEVITPLGHQLNHDRLLLLMKKELVLRPLEQYNGKLPEVSIPIAAANIDPISTVSFWKRIAWFIR